MSEEYNISPEDLHNIYNSTQVDAAIIRSDVKSNVSNKIVPNVIEEIVYEKDKEGNLIPLIDDYGKIQKDSQGNLIYKTKGIHLVQDGYKVIQLNLPLPNIASTNRNTSNLRDADPSYLELHDEQDSRLFMLQQLLLEDGLDLSETIHRHQIVRLSIESISKGKEQATIQAVKTFITKSEGRKYVENVDMVQQQPKIKPGENLLSAAMREQNTR